MSIFKARQKLSLTLTPLLTLIVFAFAAPSASAAIVHNFEPTPTKAISEAAPSCTGPGSVTGALGQVKAMTVDQGHLWLAESGEGSKERVDELNALTGACEQQLEAASLRAPAGGVAVSHGTGEREVYVGAAEIRGSKTEEGVVGVFGPSGALQSVWTGKATPEGSFAHLSGGRTDVRTADVADVAVNGSANAATAGDVYVAVEPIEQIPGAVYVFKPEAGSHGAEPAGLDAELTGTCETPGEVATGVLACAGSASIPFEELRPGDLAVDPGNGDVLVADAGRNGHPPVVDVFEPTGLGEYKYVREITGISETQPFARDGALAVGGGAEDGDIYFGEEGGAVVDQFNHEGAFLGSIEGTPSGPFLSVKDVAVDGDMSSPSAGDVFVGDNRAELGEGGVVDVFGPNLVVPNVTTEPASEETPRSATLNGVVQPLEAETGEPATCRFVWGTTEASLGSTAPCEPEQVKAGAEAAVTAKLTKLQPDTTYYFQLQASNGKGTNTNGAVLHFTTPGPGIVEASASEVASTSATLNATLEPHDVPTSYYFQYVDEERYDATAADPYAAGTSIPVTPEAIGSTPGEVKVEQHVQGLTAGATYYYRVVTISGEEFDGEGHSFTTQGAGEFALPDGRQYEMVSPPDKDGALLDGIGQAGGYNAGVIEAAADGGAITYVATVPTEPEPAGYSNETQVYSTRGPSGWSTHDLTVPHAGATGIGLNQGLEYRFFSEDLSSAIVQPFGTFVACTSSEGASQPCLSAEASEQTAFIDDLDSRAFTPLVTGCPVASAECTPAVAENANVPTGTVFGQVNPISTKACPPEALCGPEFVGATPDDEHVVLQSNVALTKTPLPENPLNHENARELYEWNGVEPPSKQLQLISVLPPTQAEEENMKAASRPPKKRSSAATATETPAARSPTTARA